MVCARITFFWTEGVFIYYLNTYLYGTYFLHPKIDDFIGFKFCSKIFSHFLIHYICLFLIHLSLFLILHPKMNVVPSF